MIHGYHVVWGTYGFWLPNDPRGSWSDFVASWELARFGTTTRPTEGTAIDDSRWARWRVEAEQAMTYPSVALSGKQARSVGRGFANAVSKSQYTIWACSILPQHVHLVIARHRYKVEQIANLLKREATRQLKNDLLHPQTAFAAADGKLPSMWGEGQWKVFLDSEAAIDAAIRYVEENPIKEGKPAQKWSFVTPFRGIEQGGWVTYE
jgi:REP element-mobilizing transposase RayT